MLASLLWQYLNKQYARPFKVRRPVRITYLQKQRSTLRLHVIRQRLMQLWLWQHQCTEENPNRLTTSPESHCQLADGYAVISGMEICVSKVSDRLVLACKFRNEVSFSFTTCASDQMKNRFGLLNSVLHYKPLWKRYWKRYECGLFFFFVHF